MTHNLEFHPAPTEPRYFIRTDQALFQPQPIVGFSDQVRARTHATQHDLAADDYAVVKLNGAAGFIAALIGEDDEDSARTYYGDAAVDEYFEEVEGLDVFAARVDIDEFTRRLELIGDEITALAHSVGFPDPGAAKAEDLLREMWAKVLAHDANLPPAVNESRALGLAG